MKKVRFFFWLTKHLHTGIKRCATKRGMTMVAWVREAVEEKLAKEVK